MGEIQESNIGATERVDFIVNKLDPNMRQCRMCTRYIPKKDFHICPHCSEKMLAKSMQIYEPNATLKL